MLSFPNKISDILVKISDTPYFHINYKKFHFF